MNILRIKAIQQGIGLTLATVLSILAAPIAVAAPPPKVNEINSLRLKR